MLFAEDLHLVPTCYLPQRQTGHDAHGPGAIDCRIQTHASPARLPFRMSRPGESRGMSGKFVGLQPRKQPETQRPKPLSILAISWQPLSVAGEVMRVAPVMRRVVQRFRGGEARNENERKAEGRRCENGDEALRRSRDVGLLDQSRHRYLLATPP